MPQKLFIDPDIRKAHTLPASFYRDKEWFDLLLTKVFHRSWQCVEIGEQEKDWNAIPFYLLDGYMQLPLVITRNSKGQERCLSNVCTHRGNLLLSGPGKAKKLICHYHGRRFKLDGTFEFMPEFEQTVGFPTACDNLPRFPLVRWGPLLFTSPEPAFDFEEVAAVMEERIGFMPLKKLVPAPERTKEYTVKAHWALYCDNYLEGFHIPFVHKDLNAVLDYGEYETLLFDHVNLQIGFADSGNEVVFDLPEGHVDFGKKVAAYYFWVFPNLMFNFYPWGLSLNIVNPITRQETRVRFKSYVWDAAKLDTGAGSGLDKVEMEDEQVVEGVQRGIQSGYYTKGRFSPTREQGVHHFHGLLARFLNE